MKQFIAAGILSLSLLTSTASYADFHQICRGASLYKYDNEIRQAVRAKYRAANIAIRGVNVEFTGVSRPRGAYVNDFASDLTIGAGDKPSVSFTGAFPDVTVCSIPMNVRIAVVFQDGSKAITVTPTTVQGTLLPPLTPRRGFREE